MSNNLQMVTGIHHVTMLASDAQQNLDFYTGVLGLRLIKTTVNFDDPTAYHLYYGDGLGTPGTLLTFFPYPGGRQAQVGPGMVESLALAIPLGATPAWREHLTDRGVDHTLGGPTEICLEDPDGLSLRLIEADLPEAVSWPGMPFPAEIAIRRVQGVVIMKGRQLGFGQIQTTEQALERLLGYQPVAPNRWEHPISGDFVQLLEPGTTRGFGGHGGVHHVAFRVADDPAQEQILAYLMREAARVSPVMDRDYFHSIYFREPGGVLFEIATDGPGFTLDETFEELGTSLRLPEMHETRREWIERELRPLRRPGTAQVEA